MLNPLWLAVLSLATAAAIYVLWGFWKRQMNFVSRPKSLAAAFLLLLLSFFPAVFLFNGFTSGEIFCLGKGCDRMYSAHEEPQFFWTNMFIIYAVFLVLFVAAAYAVYGFVRGYSQSPNNVFKGRRAKRARP
jgi:hypothetical protein